MLLDKLYFPTKYKNVRYAHREFYLFIDYYNAATPKAETKEITEISLVLPSKKSAFQLPGRKLKSQEKVTDR